MKRRRFLASSSVALGAVVGFAGCLEGGSVPPPRASDVFKRIAWGSGAIFTKFVDEPRVQSRVDFESGQGQSNSLIGLGDDLSLADLSPVGVASAKGRGKGASGRGSGSHASAPKGPRGWAIWHGGDYDEWWAEHEDDVEWYPTKITAAGIAYLGTQEEYEENAPGAGAAEWEKRWGSPTQVIKYPTQNPGWYRVGALLLATGPDYSFGWGAVDFKLVDNGSGMEVEKGWKIAPRL